ncbi:GntR family transcriptional regulator [Clostridium botulinum]|uniref:GntR family transcriptional regulator n=1 Tax=Clostridium botulinum TaxID=1491 RepID=A0A2I4NL99_CLOBO|nr:GntR family transcriptional regulator [Clostridium botulinum]KRU25290.1 GntR family transcriptional regulator [Clostridium sporogenes]APH19722.1 bacterial regulatory s, gntR family protein [Clostridium botulinum]APQ77687.1 bacterial regulatory s, gntR family protein [Clostridium botulinum]AUM92280.1 GntR family transcriptional regulator [Clostridium botulinum]AUN18649.1 GntR family transcriptional regulator [Clostridium botulinum]
MINIDSRSSKPIYEQIIDGIKENIVRGILKTGDKLPSVRELAVMLTTNPNTVSKAYKELEREKIIEVLRGKGTYISDFNPKEDEEKMSFLRKELKQLLIEAQYMGIDKKEFLKLIEEIYVDLDGKR